MNAKIVRINAILTSVMLFLYAGCYLLNVILTVTMKNNMIPLPTAAFSCLAVLIPTFVLLAFGIKQAKQKNGVFDMFSSIFTILVCALWMIAVVAEWVVSIIASIIMANQLSLDTSPIPEIPKILSVSMFVDKIVTLLMVFVVLYLVVVYLISVIRSKQKWLQIKAEIHKPAVALLIAVPGIYSMITSLLSRFFTNKIILKWGLEVYSYITIVEMYVQIGIAVLLALALAVFVLIFGLIIRKKPVAKAQSPETALQQE